MGDLLSQRVLNFLQRKTQSPQNTGASQPDRAAGTAESRRLKGKPP